MSSPSDAAAREASISPKGTVHGFQKDDAEIQHDTNQQINAVTLHLRPPQCINIDRAQDKSTDAQASEARLSRDVVVMSKGQQTVRSQQDSVEAQKEDPRQDSPLSEANSPVIEIAEPEYIDGEQQAAVIRVDGEEGDGVLRDALLSQFPLADRYGHVGAVQRITNVIREDASIPLDLLANLATWFKDQLEETEGPGPEWQAMYREQLPFWNEVSDLFAQLLWRGRHFGHQLSANAVGSCISRLLVAYVRTCSRFFQADAKDLRTLPKALATNPDLLVGRHLKFLLFMLDASELPLWSLLQQVYGVHSGQLCRSLALAFTASPGSGIRYLSQLMAELLLRVQSCPALNDVLAHCILIAEAVGEQVHQEVAGSRRSEHLPAAWASFPQEAHDLFRNVDKELAGSLGPQRLSTSTECSGHLIRGLANLVMIVARLDPQLGADLFAELAENTTTAEPRWRPILVAGIWKLRLLKRCLSKGSMSLRVWSVEAMNSELVDAWRRYKDTPQGMQHPILQSLADVVVAEKIIDYVVSVDSHPQIITRSTNVVGFLAVTDRYTRKEADAIWHTVITSQDSQVVSATVHMLADVVQHMDVSALHYLCGKLETVPIQAINGDMFNLISKVLSGIQNKNCHGLTGVSPLYLCVRLIKATFPIINSTSDNRVIFDRTTDELSKLARNASSQDCCNIYLQCAKDVEEKNQDTAASVHVISVVSRTRLPDITAAEDIKFLTEEMDMTRLAIEELCSFIRSARKQRLAEPDLPFPLKAVESRFELLEFLLSITLQDVSEELHDALLQHLIGESAISNELRDHAWYKLAGIARTRARRQEFLDRCVTKTIPQLNPKYFTSGLYKFLEEAVRYLFRTEPSIPITESGLLDLPGADLLRRVLLTAPEGTLEEPVANLLALLYLDEGLLSKTSKAVVEATHIALIQDCIKTLDSSIEDDSERDHDDMIVEQDNKARELSFTRTLLFMKQLLAHVRTMPQLSNLPRRRPQTVPPKEGEIYGDPVRVNYQSFNGTQSDVQTFIVGDLETRLQLRSRLIELTHFSDIDLIVDGKRQDLEDEPRQTLRDWGINKRGLLLVKKHRDAVYLDQYNPDEDGRSAIEREILKNFDRFCHFLSADYKYSNAAYNFLSMFPANQDACTSIANETTPVDAVFPPGKVFRSMYSIHCLSTHLDILRKLGEPVAGFALRGIRLLDSALINERFVGQTLQGPQGVQLASMMVQCLLKFLSERTNQKKACFSDPALLVTRLIYILQMTLSSVTIDPRLACNCFAAILESSIYDRRVWDAFISRGDVLELHHGLLLVEERPLVRYLISQAIAIHCSNPPEDSALDVADIASFYWQTLSVILPRITEHPRKSHEFFDVTLQVFLEAHKFDPSSKEDQIRSYLQSWSQLLLEHVHSENVGQEEVDFIVMGLARLLGVSVQFLKSLKKPINAGSLADAVFQNLLFPPYKDERVEHESNPRALVPVLERQTRKELYNLVRALCENTDGVCRLIEQTVDLYSTCGDDRSTSFERAHSIRSHSGYVGIRNLGNTCYMNSLISQLFMNIGFREFVLSMRLSDKNKSEKLLAETQRLFAYMQESYCKSADTTAFAGAIRTYENEPIDVTIQMDVEEFFGLLFDRWEQSIPFAEVKRRFRSFYGGKTIDQIKSLECEHVSERTEDFFTVQCVVKGKATLEDSLKAFVEGDAMQGDNKYKCERCGGRYVDAVKRTCLKEVPDDLIFHLKRFDIDLTTGLRSKINDLFEFPMEIDVSPYTLEYLADPKAPVRPDMFDLVGVLVHKGFAEHGHYYSYIRERSIASGEPARWVRYDDVDVTDFNPAEIADSCFGGFADSKDAQGMGYMKGHNAYMLFYERRKTAASAVDASLRTSLKASIPGHLGSRISRENERLLREHCLFKSCHTEFVQDLLRHLRVIENNMCSDDHEVEKQALDMALTHFHQVVSLTKDASALEAAMQSILGFINRCPKCCWCTLAWLASHDTALGDLLIRSTSPRVRTRIAHFVLDALRQLRNNEPSGYGIDSSDDEEVDVKDNGILAVIVARFSILLDQLSCNPKAWDVFFQMVLSVAGMGNPETAQILSAGFLTRCLELLVIHYDKNIRKENQGLWLVIDKRDPSLNGLIELFHGLLLRIDLSARPAAGERERIKGFNYSSGRFPLSQAERNLLQYWDSKENALVAVARVLDIWQTARSNEFVPGKIVGLLCSTNTDPAFEEALHTTIKKGIEDLSAIYAEPYILAAIAYCNKCVRADHAAAIVQATTNSSTHLDGQAGGVHVHFFDEVRRIHNPRLRSEHGTQFFYHLVVEHAPVWGMSLLAYDDDFAVRNGALKLLQDILFAYDPMTGPDGPVLADHWRAKAIRQLLRECLQKLGFSFQHAVSKRHMQQMLKTFDDGARWLQRLLQVENPAAEELRDPDDGRLLQRCLSAQQNMQAWDSEDEDVNASDWPTDEYNDPESDDAIELEV